MKIFIASDHRGFKYKEELKHFLSENGHDVIDKGPVAESPHDDYVDYAFAVAKEVQKDPSAKGLLLCGTGIGMYMAANKVSGVRAAECRSVEEAKIDREHHDSNILVLGEDLLSIDDSKNIILTWLNTTFAGGRHERRLKKISLYEKEYIKPFQSSKIVPSVLADNVENYLKDVQLYKTFCSRVHIDVMDGMFVQTKSPSLEELISSLNSINVAMFYHLMTNDPIAQLNRILDASNVQVVYMHIEALQGATINAELPFTLGLAISPETNIADNIEFIKDYSIVLIMTVEPGKYGSEFMPDMLNKIRELRSLGYNGEIHADGGINVDTIDEVIKFQPDLIIVGSAIHNAKQPQNAYEELVRKVEMQ